MGMPSVCSPAEWAWLEERYPSTPSRRLLDAFEAEFGRRPSAGTVYAHMSDKGIRSAVRRLEWTDEQRAFFREVVPGHTEAEISAAFAERFGTPLTEGQIGAAKTRLGVRSGTHGGRFEKGNAPHNKGRTWDEQGIPAESQERMRATCFKPGHVPDRPDGWVKPVGFERVSKDGYVEVKVRDSRESGPQPQVPGSFNCNYRMKHHVEWERANGRPVPPSTMIVFADGDTRNFDPGNLVAVPRDLWAVISRRGIPYWDAESLAAAQNVARLVRAKAAAQMRPRECKRCGQGFAPRFKRQRTCDACLGREDR